MRNALFHFKRGGQQGKKAIVNTNIAKETELCALGSFASSNGEDQARHDSEFRSGSWPQDFGSL